MMRSSNPAMQVFERPQRWEDLEGSVPDGVTGSRGTSKLMTVGGVAQVTGLLLGIAMVGALGSWVLFDRGVIPMGMSLPIFLAVVAVSVISTIVVSRRPSVAPFVGPVVSVVLGFFAGSASFFVATALGAQLADQPGLVGGTSEMTREALTQRGAFVVFQAMLLTIGVVVAMLAAVSSGLLKIRGRAARVVVGLTGALMVVYLINVGLRLVGIEMPFIHSTGPLGIAFSGFAVVLASLNLAMDFTMIEDAVAEGQPKRMEWFAGFALVTTIVWLYIEILHLLYKLYVMFNRE